MSDRRAPTAALGRIQMERTSTPGRVADQLRTMILTGDLEAGTPLREVEVATAFDISRNTVREAFLLLLQARLIVHEAHRGVSVKRLTEDDVRDIYRNRLLLETHGPRAATEPMATALERVHAVLDEAAEARASANWQQVLTLDVRFHQELVALAGSERLNAFFEGLMTELRLGLSLMEDQAPKPWLDANRRLCRTLERKGVEAYEDELRRYLAKSEQALIQRLSADDEHG